MYYTATIVGNALPGGGVDLSDPCLDISNIISVVWEALPSVGFSIANPDVCAGECTDVTVQLTGSPPFDLEYDTPDNIGQTATFNTSTGIIQVCIDAAAAPGSFNIQATSLTDANCVCD